MKTFYIYRITNLVNNKTYIGQHLCPENTEPENDTKYMGSGKHIRRAEKKYGMENFKKEILVKYIPTKERTDDLEIKYIKYERMWHGEENCYNIASGGSVGFINGHHTEDTKKKMFETHKNAITLEMRERMSERNKGKGNPMYGKNAYANKTPEEMKIIRAKISAANKGKIVSAETREKLSKALKGRKLSEHQIKILTKLNKERGLKSHWYNNGLTEKFCYECPTGYVNGRLKFSKETIDHMKGHVAPNKGKHHTAEAKEKMSKASKAKWQDPAYREKQRLISERKNTPEYRAKMSAALKGKNKGVKWTESHRKHYMEAINKKDYNNKRFLNCKHSDETRQKISNSNKEFNLVKRVREKNGTTSK